MCSKVCGTCCLFNLIIPACKQFPCWLVNEACWRQSYLQLCLKLTSSISLLKNQQTLLIPSIAFSYKNIYLAWIHCLFISLLQDWTSGSLVHEFQKGWRKTLKLIMKSTTKSKYTKSNCFNIEQTALGHFTIFLYMHYFYIVIFVYLQRWKLQITGFL